MQGGNAPFLYLSFMDAKDTLYRLAEYYGGQYTENLNEDNLKAECRFTSKIVTPRTVFGYESTPFRDEPLENLKERVRWELLWCILQKGVEYVNEQTDIFKMFNPGGKL